MGAPIVPAVATATTTTATAATTTTTTVAGSVFDPCVGPKRSIFEIILNKCCADIRVGKEDHVACDG